MSKGISLAIRFLSWLFVHSCRDSHTHVSASSSRDNFRYGAKQSQVFQTLARRPCLLRVQHREFSVSLLSLEKGLQ